MCFLIITWETNLVSLSALYRLLQNFNNLSFSVEIKAFYQRHAFWEKAWLLKPLQLKGGDLSHSACLRQTGSAGLLRAAWVPGCQGTWCQRRAWPLPCSCRSWTTSKKKAVFNQLFFLWRYKERKLIYDLKGLNKVLEGLLNAQCTVCRIFLAEKLTAANSPLKHKGFWEVPSSLVHKNNE